MTKCLILFVFIAFAAFSKAAITNSSFASDPESVATATESNGKYSKMPFLSRHPTDDKTIILWTASKSGNDYTLYRRTINATTLEKIKDSTAPGTFVSKKDLMIAYSTNGYLGIAVVGLGEDNSADQVMVETMLTDVTDETGVKIFDITSNTNTTESYKVHQIWFQDDYFYVAYTKTDGNGDDKSPMIQGVDPRFNNEKFDEPLVLTNEILKEASLRCNQVPNSANVYCAWRNKDDGKVRAASIDLDDKDVSDISDVLNDTMTEDYFPEMVIAGSDFYVLVINSKVSNNVVGFKLFSSETGLDDITNLALNLGSGFSSVSLKEASYYYKGWFAIFDKMSSTTYKATAQRYNSRGSVNGSEIDLITSGRVADGIVLSNQSYYVLMTDETATSNYDNLYLGKLFEKTSDKLFGSTLKTLLGSMFATFFMMFAF